MIKRVFNRNNFYKTLHHIKNGNFGFIVQKVKSKFRESLPQKSYQQSGNFDLFSFMFEQNNRRDDAYKEFVKHRPFEDKIKTIAFYLPQFHPIKENDENWGKGFTEWTNVSKALPQFYGHYQPRLPGELGFYDLRLKEVRHRQVELAKNYGIDGFCFHFYWFNGRRVLEKPLEDFIADKEIDFPFCINWANENWTRRWDGLESDILLEQNYSEEDDLAFIEEVSKLFTDPRYIRMDGKPLLMIYRISLFPNIKATVQRWREYCQKAGIGDIYLVLTHSFEHTDPTEVGFDAAVEFSPNTFSVKVKNDQQHFFNHNYNGMIFDYDDAVSYSQSMKIPPYKKFKTVFPSWDNEARKPGAGTSFINSTPQKYEKWLKKVYRYTKQYLPKNERFVFVNAWNEWAEGAYLEPDRKYGYAYLEATYRAKMFYNKPQQKMIVVSHDAYLHGAQYLALNIAKELSEIHYYDVVVLLNGEGPLIEDFEQVAFVYKLYELDSKRRKEIYKKLFDEGFISAIANTSSVGGVVKELKEANISSISLVHEMESVIKQYNLQNSLKLIAEYAEKVLFPSSIVEKDFKKFTHLNESKIIIQPQGTYKTNRFLNKKKEAKELVRDLLNISNDAFIVLNVGYGDHRKGIDKFVETGLKVLERGYEIHFVWIGNLENSISKKVLEMVKKSDYRSFFHFPGFFKDVSYIYTGSDIFFMSSREDPFPTVVMEAMEVGLPVIGFKNAGGFTELLEDNNGLLANYLDTNDVAEKIIELFNNKDKYELLSVNAKKKIATDYNFTLYVEKLLKIIQKNLFKVSVIIPNYNYSKYIEARIESILTQTYPIYEIIFLDDNSSDNSVEIAERILKNANIPYQIVKNDINSGSVFKQWAKGISLAKGDYIWIAEADDLCDITFLAKVIQGFHDKNVILSYTQSKMIDENNNILEPNYLSYTNDIDTEKWKSDYINNGEKELKNILAIKNTIPNVSAVVFKKVEIDSILNKLLDFKVAGDWFFYYWLLKQGSISYVAESLNLHRRHTNSVTGSLNKKRHFDEIIQMQEMVVNDFGATEEVERKIINYRKYVKKYLGV